MAAIVFPTSPTAGQVFSYGNRSWVWNTLAWQSTYQYSYEVDGGADAQGQTIVYVSLDGGTA